MERKKQGSSEYDGRSDVYDPANQTYRYIVNDDSCIHAHFYTCILVYLFTCVLVYVCTSELLYLCACVLVYLCTSLCVY